MSAAKSTPGPWAIIGEKDLPEIDDLMIVAFDVAVEGERPDDSIYICNVGSEGGVYGKVAPVDAGERWPISLANAKLIAAAPALADRLEARACCAVECEDPCDACRADREVLHAAGRGRLP